MHVTVEVKFSLLPFSMFKGCDGVQVSDSPPPVAVSSLFSD